MPPIHSVGWNWRSYLAAVYLLGFGALLVRLAMGTVRARMLVRRAVNCEGRFTSDSCAVPVTVGLLNPTVILPECWRQWPRAQLNAVLSHEGEHARRRDPLVQWLALLNRAVFWFHPLAWWLERRLSALAEEACDAAVLARGHDPFDYSEYLMEIARVLQQTGVRVNVIGMAMAGPMLPKRIQRILEGLPAQRISRMRMACVAVACLVVSIPFTTGSLGYAQGTTVNRALVSGTVEDPSGAVVPQCIVTARNQNGAAIAVAVSDPAGIYRFASIPPGRYNLEFATPGFALLRVEAEIEAGKPVRIDARLDLGQANESVTVTGEKPAAPALLSAQPTRTPVRIRVGGNVRPIRQLVKTTPVYPPELQQQGVEGTVVMRAVISREGVPLNPHVLNRDEVDPRFAQAALDSVRHWLYEPSLLNGNPVEVATTITVEFRLGK